MKKFPTGCLIFFLAVPWMVTGIATAHVTPTVKLSTTQEAISRLLPQGKLFLKEVRLSSRQMSQLKSFGNWSSHENHYKFFVSRDQNNNLQRTAVFITEYTRHGPLVVAVALDPNGKVVDALVTDIQTEQLEWVGPLLRRQFLNDLKGKGSDLPLTLNPKWESNTTRMTQSFALILVNAVKRSAQLFDQVFK